MNAGNPHKQRRGLSRVLHAFGYSMQGFAAAWRHETAFRQEALLSLVMLPLGWWLAEDALQLAALWIGVALVLIVELLNSAIEAVVDRISLELHPLAKRAKDYGSAAVLLALVGCAGLWLAVAWQRFFAHL